MVRRHPAIRRRKNIRYAYVVKAGYEEIQKLRNEGYSYDNIRDALVASGIFEEGSESGSLCSAFWRETKRRARREGPEADMPESGNGHRKPENEKSAADYQETSAADGKGKRLRELTGGPVIDTGTGSIRKLPGGSFEF